MPPCTWMPIDAISMPALGAQTLHDRDQQVAARLRGGAHRFVRMRGAEIELVRGVQRQRARQASTVDFMPNNMRFTSG